MPVVENNPSVPIAAGKLSKVIEFASKVSPADYYGLSIDCGGSVLKEKEIQAIAQRTVFSKSRMLREKISS